MEYQQFSKCTRLACSAAELYAWHCRPEALPELIPPWEKVQVSSDGKPLHDGQRVALRISAGLFRLRWISEISELQQDRQFVDTQLSGPFAYWKHLHRFNPISDAVCEMEDVISYRLPLDPLASLVAGKLVRGRLERMFGYRHGRLLEIFGPA